MKSEAGMVDRYELTPMQQGLLLESLYAPHSGVNVEQIVGHMREDLDGEIFRKAWDRIVERHVVLRTAFRWDGRGDAAQEVLGAVEIPFVEEDWHNRSEGDQELSLEKFLRVDRTRGFELETAPWIRVALFRCGSANSWFVWTFHHALLDGRSFPIVLREVFDVYSAISENRRVDLAPVRPFRDHVDWLRQQDFRRAEKYWRELFRGFVGPAPLPIPSAGGRNRTEGRRKQRVQLAAWATERLRSSARSHELTLNTMLHGAWAILLSRYGQQNDVVFGAVRACRSSGVPDAAGMVGLFINTLPVRVQVKDEVQLGPWLKQLRAQHLAAREVEHTPLVQLQQWVSESNRGSSLLQNVIVFDHERLNSKLRSLGGAWSQREFELREQTSFPLTLYGYAEAELLLEVAYERKLFDDAAITRMLGHLAATLERMPEHLGREMGTVTLLTDAEEEKLLRDWNATEAPFPDHRCVHEEFEKRVAKIWRAAPDAVPKYSQKLWVFIVNLAAFLSEKDLFCCPAQICF